MFAIFSSGIFDGQLLSLLKQIKKDNYVVIMSLRT